MKLNVRVKDVFSVRKGVSQRTGNEWKATPVVFEELAVDWPQSIIVDIFEDPLPEGIRKGAVGTLYFGIMAKASAKGIYNQIRFNKFIPQGAEQPAGNDVQLPL